MNERMWEWSAFNGNQNEIFMYIFLWFDFPIFFHSFPLSLVRCRWFSSSLHCFVLCCFIIISLWLLLLRSPWARIHAVVCVHRYRWWHNDISLFQVLWVSETEDYVLKNEKFIGSAYTHSPLDLSFIPSRNKIWFFHCCDGRRSMGWWFFFSALLVIL